MQVLQTLIFTYNNMPKINFLMEGKKEKLVHIAVLFWWSRWYAMFTKIAVTNCCKSPKSQLKQVKQTLIFGCDNVAKMFFPNKANY